MLQDLKSGGEEAHKALKNIYRDNYPRIVNMIVKKGGSEEDAKDVFQDSMIAFHKMIMEDRFREEAQINTVIYAIARNLWYQKFRNRKLTEDLSEANETNTVELDFDWEEFSREKVIRKVIGELSEDCQKVIRLFYYERESMEKIQFIFGLNSTQAAKNKKYRCMKSLLEIFKKRGLKRTSF